MKKRVFLAEDEPNIVVSLSFLLEREGYDVTSESNGERALELVQAHPPDVVVLDVMLPALDGFEILRKLRADARTSALPVLMLTAKGQREDREHAESMGVDVFISKPFSNAEFVAAVRHLMQENSK